MCELTNFTDVFKILACSWRTLSWFSSMYSLSVMHDHKGDLFSLLRFVFLFSRQYRLERELKSRLWKIDYNQLGFERRASNTSLASAMVCFFDPQETLIMSDINAPTGLQNFWKAISGWRADSDWYFFFFVTERHKRRSHAPDNGRKQRWKNHNCRKLQGNVNHLGRNRN